MIIALLFDMDGVLLESVDIKTLAFKKLFSSYPDNLETIIKYHQENQGVSRYEKIPYIFHHIIQEPLKDELKGSLLQQFAEYIKEAMDNVPLVTGCSEFFNTYSHIITCAVISAAPEPEVIDILTKKGIANHFKMICGSPISKTDNMNHFLHSYRLEPRNAIMIGDSLTDYYAAQQVGCRFIGRIPEGDENLFFGKEGVELVIKDFNDLMLYISEVL